MLCEVFECAMCEGTLSLIKNKKTKCLNCGVEGFININNFSTKKDDDIKVIVLRK